MNWAAKMKRDLLALPGVKSLKWHAVGFNVLELTIDGGDDTEIALVIFRCCPKTMVSVTRRPDGSRVCFEKAAEILRQRADKRKATAAVDTGTAAVDNYPHKCPRCGQRAYVGFASVEHEGKACA